VQRLRDVAEEMHEEAHGLGDVRGAEAAVAGALGVVCDGGDGAAGGAAVACVVDAAGCWRVVLGVDKVQRC
jgi:hypothetical protein